MVYKSANDCSGCGACVAVCEKQAISMEEDKEGFLYPKINIDNCIKCGKCVKVCSFRTPIKKLTNKYPLVYALKHRDDTVRYASSSGGAFTAFSDPILKSGGIVYGAGYDIDMRVIHKEAISSKERDELRGSKYVQSNLANIFESIKENLLLGKVILFVGTPCQCASINSYLEKYDLSNLYLCDLLCRGVGSPLIWHEHIQRMLKKGKIIDYRCRSKIKGWGIHTEETFYFGGKSDYKSGISQEYKNLFHSHLILRPSCYNCPFTKATRPSDITIGDFWGIEKCLNDFRDKQGVSVVLINSDKGEYLYKLIKNDVWSKQSSLKECMQPSLYQNVKMPEKRTEFWKDYYRCGFNYIANKYGGCSITSCIKRKIKEIVLKNSI